MRGGKLVALSYALLFSLSFMVATAQQAHYTVQVVALSDRQAAVNTVEEMLRQGYPAYAVRSHSSEGDVFRVRVGAFGNRAAALLYAEAMPQVAGGQPVPALAEAIPQGITPLVAKLLLTRDLAGLEATLVLVGGVPALRTQQRDPLKPAEYAVMRGDVVELVHAWLLFEDADGTRFVVRDMVLWPETWQDESDDVLKGYENTLISLVAETLALDDATVANARYGASSESPPRLIVVERSAPGATGGPELLGLGLPQLGMSKSGALRYLGVEEETLLANQEGVVELDIEAGVANGTLPLLSAQEGEPAEPEETAEAEVEAEAEEVTEIEDEEGEDDEAAEEMVAATVDEVLEESEAPRLAGAGWSAEPDGPFVRLTVDGAEEGSAAHSWRAAFGTPLWTGGNYLAARVGTTLLFYDLQPRP